MKCKNAFSAVLDVTIVFYALFTLGKLFSVSPLKGYGHSGVREGNFGRLVGGQDFFSLFGARGEESVYVRDLRPPMWISRYPMIRCLYDLKIGILGL